MVNYNSDNSNTHRALLALWNEDKIPGECSPESWHFPAYTHQGLWQHFRQSSAALPMPADTALSGPGHLTALTPACPHWLLQFLEHTSQGRLLGSVLAFLPVQSTCHQRCGPSGVDPAVWTHPCGPSCPLDLSSGPITSDKPDLPRQWDRLPTYSLSPSPHLASFLCPLCHVPPPPGHPTDHNCPLPSPGCGHVTVPSIMAQAGVMCSVRRAG